MELNTCAQIISLVEELESKSADFYREVSQRFGSDEELLHTFATENEKSIVAIKRAYFGVITDAIEGCFAFSVNPRHYVFEADVASGMNYGEAVGKAIEIEEKMIQLYGDAGEQSRSLMADLPRAFALIAKKHLARIAKLRLLVE